MLSSTKKTFTVVVSVLLVVAMCGLVFSVIPEIGNLGKDNKTKCSHNIEYVEAKAVTCTEDGWEKYSYCTKCGYDNKKLAKALGHSFYLTGRKIVCNNCEATFTPENGYVFDGMNTDGLTGNENNSLNFGVTSGTNLPLVNTNDGNYSFLKKTTTADKKQAQLWIPKEATGISGFSSANNAVGIFSSRLNVNVDDIFEVMLVEGISSNRWSADWCISTPIFKIVPVVDSSGALHYKFYSFYDDLLYMCKADKDGFTGWFDLHIGIELNALDDTVTFIYYVNGNLCGSSTTAITTQNNSFTSLYISAKTKSINSGYLFDDLVFGYSKNGEWDF